MADPIAAALAAGRIAPHEVDLARRLVEAEMDGEDSADPGDTWVAACLADLPRGRASSQIAASYGDDPDDDAAIAALYPPRTRQEADARADAALRHQRRIAASADSAYSELFGAELDREIDRLSAPGSRHGGR